MWSYLTIEAKYKLVHALKALGLKAWSGTTDWHIALH